MIKIRLDSIQSVDQLIEVMDWCEETFGPCKRDRLGRWTGGRWCIDNDLYWSFKFVNHKDASMFVLKWI